MVLITPGCALGRDHFLYCGHRRGLVRQFKVEVEVKRWVRIVNLCAIFGSERGQKFEFILS